MRRTAVVAGVFTAAVLGLASPAVAGRGWGSTTCSQTPTPACELGAGTSSAPGKAPGAVAPNAGRPGGGTKPGNGKPANPGDTITGGDANMASCSYVKSDYQPPSGGTFPVAHAPRRSAGGIVPVARPRPAPAQAAQPGQGPGAWYVWKCSGEGSADTLYRPPVWIADGEQPGAAQLPSPEELAQMARRQLRLPSPTISANPAGDQLVNLPTWMWLSSGGDPVTATASVPGVSVTTTATPGSVTWSMGDGSTVLCNGAGTPYAAGGDPAAPSPDCGHVYRRSSAGQPGQAFGVTATVHWTVSWFGAGQGGTFPDMTTTSTTSFRVAESQALNNGGG